MNRPLVLLLIFCWLFVLSTTSRAGLVVTEVMADEPGGSTSLEWIEIYNNSPDIIFLGLYPLQVMDDTSNRIILPGGLGAYQYVIVCRKLYGNGGSPAFEEVWGDSSGVWGDSPLENYKEPIVWPFPSLVNSGGAVAILDPALEVISEFIWTRSVGDGISWERESFDSDALLASVDPLGGTPGFVNSVTPLGHDLDLQTVTVARVDDATEITFSIKNRSLGYVLGGDLTVFRVNESDPGDRTDVLRTVNLPGFDSAEVVVITEQFLMSGTYFLLGGALDDDDRARNNVLRFAAPGADYPPVILTEVQARPTGWLYAEWVEVYNRTDTTINLADWWLGDAIDSHLISSSTVNVEPGDYLVLTDDTADFRAYYSDPDIQSRELEPLPQSVPWPRFNNNGDIVRLVDLFGLEADRFVYDLAFDSNYTWSRVTSATGPGDWGRSLEKDGTPGQANQVLLEPTGSSLELEIIPQVFSPDGDGWNDRAAISVVLPEASGYTLKIYDQVGREVRTFLDGDKLINPDDVDGERSIWFFDGLDNNGQRLPIGIYIIYFEATGLETIKGSVVIAR